MITIKKIKTLKPRVQVRKAADGFHNCNELDSDYLASCFEILAGSPEIDDESKMRISYLYSKGDEESLMDIYYVALTAIGENFADWDASDSGKVDWSTRRIKEHYLYLDGIRSPYNVGSIFRSAESFGIKKIFLSPGTASPLHPRSVRTSRNTVEGVEWEYRDIDEIDQDLPLFALELGGEEISSFHFPDRGICIIGSEESGVSSSCLKRADESMGRVSIALSGAKGSINVSAASAILLYSWKN